MPNSQDDGRGGDNGQGDVKNPATDGRLKENRNTGQQQQDGQGQQGTGQQQQGGGQDKVAGRESDDQMEQNR